jgi:hypothetical protein
MVDGCAQTQDLRKSSYQMVLLLSQFTASMPLAKWFTKDHIIAARPIQFANAFVFLIRQPNPLRACRFVLVG